MFLKLRENNTAYTVSKQENKYCSFGGNNRNMIKVEEHEIIDFINKNSDTGLHFAWRENSSKEAEMVL